MSYDSTLVNGQTSSIGENLAEPQQQELYIQIKDEVVDQIIEHGLSKTESKLFFQLLKYDRFGDRPVKVKVAEILLATGISKARYHLAIAKFEAMGWFSFKHSDVEISNFCVPTKLSRKRDTESRKRDTESRKRDTESRKRDTETLKILPVKSSETSQTYSDLLNTLPEGVRERFDKFCKKKIEESSFKINSRKLWLNKHGAEYWEEFQEKCPNALANSEVTAPNTLVSAVTEMVGKKPLSITDSSPPKSLAVEIQDESEQVTPSKFASNAGRPSPEQFRELRQMLEAKALEAKANASKKPARRTHPEFIADSTIAVDCLVPVEDNSGAS